MEQLGGVAEASAELVCQHMEAYLKDLRYMAEHDDVKAEPPDPGRLYRSQQSYLFKAFVVGLVEAISSGQKL